MYSLEKKDGTLDYSKRQILLVQENYRIFVPLLSILFAALLALNIANAVHNFMAVYICVVVNLVGVGVGCGVVLLLIKGNARQRSLFELMENKFVVDCISERAATYESDSVGVLQKAGQVRICETETEYVVLPLLPKYKHALFTRYDFRSDFGRLRLPKDEYGEKTDEDGDLIFTSESDEFRFKVENAVEEPIQTIE